VVDHFERENQRDTGGVPCHQQVGEEYEWRWGQRAPDALRTRLCAATMLDAAPLHSVPVAPGRGAGYDSQVRRGNRPADRPAPSSTAVIQITNGQYVSSTPLPESIARAFHLKRDGSRSADREISAAVAVTQNPAANLCSHPLLPIAIHKSVLNNSSLRQRQRAAGRGERQRC
jgi:hypothetical protein